MIKQIFSDGLDEYHMQLLDLIKDSSDFDALTLTQIQQMTWLDHPQKIYNRLDQLVKKGYITEDYELIRYPDQNMITLPFFGWAQCGNNGSAIFQDYPRSRMQLSLQDLGMKLEKKNIFKFFITRAKGKSMEPEISSWDDLLVEHTKDFMYGVDKVLLVHNDKPKIKKIVRDGNQLSLESLNPDYPAIVLDSQDDIDIVGIVRDKIAL